MKTRDLLIGAIIALMFIILTAQKTTDPVKVKAYTDCGGNDRIVATMAQRCIDNGGAEGPCYVRAVQRYCEVVHD